MTTITRRTALSGLAAVAGASLVPPLGAQTAYPAGVGTIKIVIPFAPGGGSDVIGRLLADSLTRRWGVPSVLMHVPGASGTIGMGRVAHGPADGSQILILPLPYITTQFTMSALSYDPERDIAPLSQLTRQPNLFCVKKDLPVSSVAEFIAYAKERPGQLNFASSGVGTPLHLAAELFQQMTGVRMTHIPYSGSAPAQNDLIAGHVDVLFDNVVAIQGFVRSGAVKALGITTPTRFSLAPEFPAVAEAVPGYIVSGWTGLAVKAGTPMPIQDKIEAAGLELVKEQATIDRLSTFLSEPVGTNRAAFAHFIAEERQRWGSLIQKLDLKG